MGNSVPLPKSWSQTPLGRRLIDEGVHSVVVDEAKVEGDADDGSLVVKVILQILDEGAQCGWRLHETFKMSSDHGLGMFKEFLTVLDIPQDGEEVNLDLCKRRVLRVVVRHREAPETGLRYANVARHLPDDRQGERTTA